MDLETKKQLTIEQLRVTIDELKRGIDILSIAIGKVSEISAEEDGIVLDEWLVGEFDKFKHFELCDKD